MKKQIPFLLSLFFLSVACRKEKTRWDTEWGAPIINDTLSLANYYNDSTLVSNDGSTLNLNLSRTILNLGINDLIKIPDTVITQTTSPLFNISSISPGTSFINETEEHQLNLNGIQLKKVIISTGRIKVKVYNPIATKAFYTVQIPGATKNGSVFEQTYFVDAGTNSNPSTKEELLDLSGYTLDLTGTNFLNFNKLQSKIMVKTDPDGPSVSVLTSNIFRFDAEISDIKFDYAKGYFGNQNISDTSNVTIDFLNNFISGSLDLPSLNLSFHIENGVKVSMKGGLTLVENINSSGNTVSLNSSTIGSEIIVSPATGVWNSLTPSSQSIEFNSTNSNIEQYLENLGSNNKIGYNFQLNPWGNLSGGNDEIFPNSRIKVKLNGEMPMTIGSDGLTLRDTFDINFPNDESKTHVNSGVITLTAINAFPMSCQPIIYLLDENNFILHTVIGSSEISSALFGSIDQNDNLFKKKSTVIFQLNESISMNFKKVKKVIIEGVFNTPNPENSFSEPQNIPYGAFLTVNLKIKLNSKIVL